MLKINRSITKNSRLIFDAIETHASIDNFEFKVGPNGGKKEDKD